MTAEVSIPVIGMGGIETGADALGFLASGASAVAVGTASFRDPAAAERIRAELAHGAQQARPRSAPGSGGRFDLDLRSTRISPKTQQIALHRARTRDILAAADGPASVDTASAAVPADHEQRMRALRRANEIRSARAKLKRDLQAGKAQIEKLLLDPPDYVLSAKAFDAVSRCQKYGRVKANKILTQCRISPSKTIGGLSERQRAELVQFLRRWALPGARGDAHRSPPDRLRGRRRRRA